MHVPIVSGYADVPVDAQSTGIEGYRLLVFVKRPMNIPVSLRRSRDFYYGLQPVEGVEAAETINLPLCGWKQELFCVLKKVFWGSEGLVLGR